MTCTVYHRRSMAHTLDFVLFLCHLGAFSSYLVIKIKIKRDRVRKTIKIELGNPDIRLRSTLVSPAYVFDWCSTVHVLHCYFVGTSRKRTRERCCYRQIRWQRLCLGEHLLLLAAVLKRQTKHTGCLASRAAQPINVMVCWRNSRSSSPRLLFRKYFSFRVVIRLQRWQSLMDCVCNDGRYDVWKETEGVKNPNITRCVPLGRGRGV